ncbi:MAG: aminoacyl-tRNA hydrolase, partial [Clostridiales bacterium]|nr:aminoacyl-tRNA hydrolase [Clostridiales bacterium]
MSIFGRTKSSEESVGGSPIEYIIAGLGNPGKEYELSRHNAGFLCLDILSNRLNFRTDRMKFKSLCADVQVAGHRCLVMRPQTYMNNSGEAIKQAASFYKIPPEKCIIIFDDIDIPFGAVRVKRKGSAGSHNGVKSIVYHLNSDNFPRVKIGVGGKPNPDYDLKDYVLGKFNKHEQDVLKVSMEKACDAAELIVAGKIEKAMETCQL